ncbi:MAG: hypothetical protein ACT4P6_07770 [Gemmatimonadaceae bacterium]
MKTKSLVLGVGTLLTLTASLGAQDSTVQRDREALRRRFQERFGAVVKQRLQLNDSQVVRLGETNRRFEEQRRLLLQQERDVRMSLRDELLAEQQGRGNQQRVSTLLERAIAVQKQRVDLLETEQRELARFLNPTQRAKLLGMQDQLRRNAGDIRRRAEAGGGPPGGLRERIRERRDSGRPPIRRPLRDRPPI